MRKEGRGNKESRSLCVIALLWREQNIAAEGCEGVSAYIHSICLAKMIAMG